MTEDVNEFADVIVEQIDQEAKLGKKSFLILKTTVLLSRKILI